MAKCPFAVQRIIPESETQPKIVPVHIIDHSAGGYAELYAWWMSDASHGLESHFWIALDGTIVQYVDTEVRADANLQANRYWSPQLREYVGAVSIETASSTHATEPWTPAQVASLVKLHIWLIETHPTIKPVEMASPFEPGQVWHVKFGAPGPYTKAAGKVCPGAERIRQCRQVIYPAVAAHFKNPPSNGELTVTQYAELKARIEKLELASYAKDTAQDKALAAQDGKLKLLTQWTKDQFAKVVK